MSKDKKNKWEWIKKTFPKVKEVIGNVLPDKGILGIVKNIIDKDDTIPPELKKEALGVLYDLEKEEIQAITKRWESDMASDSKLSKSVRPLTMMFLTLFLTVLIFVDSSSSVAFKVDSAYIDLLKGLLMLVYFAYFGGRTAEKWKKLNK